jgi:hypothetical protein
MSTYVDFLADRGHIFEVGLMIVISLLLLQAGIENFLHFCEKYTFEYNTVKIDPNETVQER